MSIFSGIALYKIATLCGAEVIYTFTGEESVSLIAEAENCVFLFPNACCVVFSVRSYFALLL